MQAKPTRDIAAEAPGAPVSGRCGGWRSSIVPVVGVLLVWAAWSAAPVPGVNEAHYFTKARQFWDPAWLPRDLFLGSQVAHWLFYAVLGWPTTFLSMDTTVWLSRALGWSALALGWCCLTKAWNWTAWETIAGAVLFAVCSSELNLSGEWVIGGSEAKVFAYAAVLCALAAACRSRWSRVWMWLGLATAWHPLVGGWSFLILLGVRLGRWRLEPGKLAEYWSLAGGVGCGLLLGVVPALRCDWGVDPDTQHLAHWIYVRQRLAHHLYVWDFPIWSGLRFAGMLLVWREFSRGISRSSGTEVCQTFAWGSMGLVLIGIVLSSAFVPDWIANSLLRFYWYRLADFAIPLVAAWAVIEALATSRRRASPGRASGGEALRVDPTWERFTKVRSWCAGLLLLAALVVVGNRAVDHARDPVSGSDRQALPEYPGEPERTAATRRNWHRVCAWVQANTPRDAFCLTPRYQQTFKWLAERAEYVNWKDVPQDARSLVVWAERMSAVYGGGWDQGSPLWMEPTELAQLAAEHQVDYLIAEQRDYEAYQAAGWVQGWERIYPPNAAQQTTYVVLKRLP